MNKRYIKLTALSASLLLPLALVLLLLIPMMATSKERSTSSASSESLSQVLTQTAVLSGSYEGTVAITVPIQLGVLDLAFELTDEGGTLAGHVNRSHTLVYDDEPALSGAVETSVTTPTFTLESALFDDVVSNRHVERQFTLVGEVLEGGEVLQGVYSEVMTGFTPQPLNMEGLFMVTRPPNTIETTNLLVLTTNSVRTGTNGQVVATARVLDAEGQPVSGIVVTFSSQLGTMSPASGTTNANGIAISTFTAGNMPGQASIEATCCDGTSNTVLLQVESQAPTTIDIAAADSTLSMGSQSVITATVRDQFDNPISGTVVTFQGTLGSIAPASAVTDENGQASATFTAGNDAGQATITVLAGSASDSSNIEIIESATPTTTPTVSPTPTAIASNTPSPSATPTGPTATATPPSTGPTISEVRTTNVRDVSFTVSWVTDIAATGEVRYGTDPNNLNQTAVDARPTSDDTHYVTIENLDANTTYYFDVMSDGITDDNSGQHYSVTTGPTLGVPGSDTIYGQVLQADGSSLAVGSIVYITLQDANGAGSSGEAAPLSALVDDTGYWFINLAEARESSLAGYFTYSSNSGDQIKLKAEGAADGKGCRTIGTDEDSPAPTLSLGAGCSITWHISIQPGWNNLALPIQPTTDYDAESLCNEIALQGGNVAEIDRWNAGGWSGHICTLPFNNYALNLEAGYFAKASQASTWTVTGLPVTSPQTFALQSGWNSVSLPNNATYTAESLCNAIIGQGVTAVEIDRWNAGGWSGHICNLPFNDFPIEVGQGYFVKASSSGTVSIAPSDLPLQQPEERVSDSEQMPTGPAQAVNDLQRSNLSDTSITLSWLTEEATTGYVLYGETPELGQMAFDVRGRTTSDQTHLVVLNHLKPETSYYFKVVSGVETSRDSRADTFTTAPSLEKIPDSDTAYGQVFWADGKTPAAGALVYLTLQDADRAGSEGEATLLSALVDEEGYWHANLGNARSATNGDTFTYSERGDKVVLTVQSGTDSTITESFDTSERPATPIILEQQEGWQLYLPLIND